MEQIMRSLFLLLLLGFASQIVGTTIEGTGAELLLQCKLGVRAADGEKLRPADMIAARDCMSYVRGVLDGHAISSTFGGKQIAFCLPNHGISPYQAARVIVRWAEDNPKHLHKRRASAAALALSEAFPCGAK
jgi:hypothetical protein